MTGSGERASRRSIDTFSTGAVFGLWAVFPVTLPCMTLLLFGQIIVEDLFCFEMSLAEFLWWAFVRLTPYM